MTNTSDGFGILNPARWLTALFVVLTFGSSLLAQNGTVSFTEYSIPTVGSLPVGIANGPDGAAWFVERSKVGRITTNGTITEYADAGGGLYITNGPDGALWFTGNGKIKRITTSGEASQFTLPSTSSDAYGIATGPDGALWFTANSNSRIGRMTTGGVVTEYALVASSSPQGITAGPDGALWFTEWNRNRIGRITTDGTISEYTIPTTFSGPADIVAGPDGALWFTESSAGKIGRITTAGVITEFPLLTKDSPRSIASSPDGFLWIAQRGWIVKMSTDGIVNEYRVPNISPSYSGQVSELTAGSGGIIWFTESGRIGRMDSAGNVSGATLVQSYSKGATSVPSISLPMGRTTAGNTILVFVRLSTTTQTVSISDTTGNSYVEAVSQVQDQESHQIHVFYASGIVGGAITVRADFSDTNDHPWLAAFEYAGLRSASPLDQIAHAQGFGANANSGNTPITTQPYELLFAGTGQQPTTYDPVTAGQGYILYQTDAGPSRAAVEAVAVNGSGSYAAPFSTNDVQVWSAVLATFVADAPVGAPSITTTSMPAGNQNGSYSAEVSTSGGAAPLKWSIVSGSLPPGIILYSETGNISGNSSSAGNYSFTVGVTDANQQSASQALSISIGAEAPRIEVGFQQPLPDGRRGSPYSAGISVRGGTPPYTLSVISGSLPSGLTLTPTSGFSGTPTDSRVSNFTLQVTDANSLSATKDLSITVYDWTEEDAASVVFSGLWNMNTSSSDSGGTAQLAMDPGARAKFTFTGTQVSWIGLREQYSGIANVYVDDILVATVDTYASFAAYKSHLYTAAGLANAEHTLTIEATGTHNSVSAGAWVWVDAFETLGDMGSGPVFPAITTSSLPVATQDHFYTAALAAMGGAPPYSWAIVSYSGLPAGLSLNSADGTISGSPNTLGWNVFNVQLRDANSMYVYRELNISVLAPGLTVTTSSLPSITQNGSYDATLAATGGSAPYTWSIVSGSLPSGLSLASTNGRISGTPDSAGTSNFTVQVTDSNSQTALKALSITINSTPVVTTNSLPDTTVNAFYNGTLAASLGTPPYTWTIVAGSLPPGLMLFGTNNTNQIQGSPNAAGTSEFTVQVSDTRAQTATKVLSITVNSRFSINNSSLPSGTKGTPYSTTLTASGGETPYTWSVVSGALNSGLSLGPANGVISGTPDTGGASNFFTVQVSDGQGQTTKLFSISVSDPGFAITTSSLPNGLQNAAYSASLSGSGGTPPYSWSVISGTLPVGLTLNPNSGAISGTPTEAGTTGFAVRLAEANGLTTTRSLTITVNLNAVTISTMSLPDGTQHAAYSATLAATGGVTPFAWSITSGSLPSGLSLNSANGAISGTPQCAGTSNFTVQVTDAGSQSATKQFSVVIQPSGVECESNIDETHPSIVYVGTWNSNGGSFNSGGSAVLATDPGATATVYFTGTGITWIGYSDEWSGIANVYVDGEIQSTVDTYQSPAQNQASEYAINGLAPGSHTLMIEVTGTHSPDSAQSWIWVDAFRIQP